MKVVKLNVDEAQAIASRYGVQGIPLLVLIRGGSETNRLVGAVPLAQLQAWLTPYLTATGESVRPPPGLDADTSMTIILVMSETLPLSSVKAHLSELVDRVEDQHDRVVLTRNGKPAAVLISPDDLESLEETLSILSDPALMEQIHESEQALADGAQGTTLAELRAGLESRRNAAA